MNELTYTIGPGRVDEVAFLPPIELAAARLLVGHAPESILSVATSNDELARACRDGRLWVARAADRPVGFAYVEVFEPGVAHLHELDVHPDHGRRGIGRRLVTTVCEWATGKQFESVTLSTFRGVRWNMPFYAKLGFEVVSRNEFTPALQAVVDDEVRRGLDPEQRVVMRYVVDSGIRRGMSVRPPRLDDRPRLLDLWERSVRATHDFLAEGDVEALKPLVADELASDALDWTVIEADGVLIGFLGFANDSIEALFIDPDRRGQGAGSVLIEHAQQLARGTVGVDVNEQNDAARRFYERRGFAVVGRSPTDSGGRPFPILHMKRVR